MLKISHLLPKIPQQPTKIQPKTIIISQRNGKSFVKEEIVGNNIYRPSFLDAIKDLLADLLG